MSWIKPDNDSARDFEPKDNINPDENEDENKDENKNKNKDEGEKGEEFPVLYIVLISVGGFIITVFLQAIAGAILWIVRFRG